jgi:hypothetical protein
MYWRVICRGLPTHQFLKIYTTNWDAYQSVLEGVLTLGSA